MSDSASPDRAGLLDSALRLSYFTVAWNGIVGAAALAVAVVSGSLAVAGFGLSALLDSSASVVLVWRFLKEQRDPEAAERFERHAQAVMAVAMTAIGLYIGVQGVRALVQGSHPDSTAFGIALAAVSIAVLPLLGRRKLQVARGLASPAMRGDGIITSAAALLAAATLAALLLNSQLGWWWADPGAALLIAAALGIEGVRIGVRHRFG